jgi:hypothetical protein
MLDISARETASNAYDTDAARWAAFERRDRAADGRFVCAVRTTGVYCRPSCAGRPKRENVRFFATNAAAEAAGFRACKRCRPERLADRALDWDEIGRELDQYGCAVLKGLLSPAQCQAIASRYDNDTLFRSRIVMARHGFGRGEYKYFAYPLPEDVKALRETLYPPLAEIANRWNAALGKDVRYPAALADFLARCHKAGQTRPTPLLLRYEAGDYNCLHQDLYGEHVFPLQVAFLLSAPGRDFSGGEFVITEQRPRMQSRAEVVPLAQGDGVVFAVHHRPVAGTRGTYRVNLRHGVSRVRTGRRHTLGVILHDAQ